MNNQYENEEEQLDNNEVAEEATDISELAKELEVYEEAPDEPLLEAWKSTYGKFFVSSILGDETIFIWRTINRSEYKQLANSGVMKNQNSYEEAVVRKCVLWPIVTQEGMSMSDAGVVPTLCKQILFKSGFVSDNLALSLIKVI